MTFPNRYTNIVLLVGLILLSLTSLHIYVDISLQPESEYASDSDGVKPVDEFKGISNSQLSATPDDSVVRVKKSAVKPKMQPKTTCTPEVTQRTIHTVGLFHFPQKFIKSEINSCVEVSTSDPRLPPKAPRATGGILKINEDKVRNTREVDISVQPESEYASVSDGVKPVDEFKGSSNSPLSATPDDSRSSKYIIDFPKRSTGKPRIRRNSNQDFQTNNMSF